MGEIEILRECDSPAIVKYYGNEVYEGYLWVRVAIIHNLMVI